jgi:hypothetical protein
MATIAKELHDVLGTLIDQLTMMVADLQKVNTKQQDCLFKLDVMVGIKSVNMKPSPTLLLSPPLPSTTNLVQPLLEMMDAMSMLHPSCSGSSMSSRPQRRRRRSQRVHSSCFLHHPQLCATIVRWPLLPPPSPITSMLPSPSRPFMPVALHRPQIH